MITLNIIINIIIELVETGIKLLWKVLKFILFNAFEGVIAFAISMVGGTILGNLMPYFGFWISLIIALFIMGLIYKGYKWLTR